MAHAAHGSLGDREPRIENEVRGSVCAPVAAEDFGAEEPGAVRRLKVEHLACACGAVTGPCGSGIAHQTAGPHGLELLCRAVEDEKEPLATVTLLLRLCRDEHRTLWECAREPTSLLAVADLTDLLTPLLPAPGSKDVGDAQDAVPSRLRTAMAAALRRSGDVPPVVVAHALAELLDARFWPSFATSFVRRSPYQPGVGDPVPISSPDVRGVVDMTLTSPPWRLANRMDSTRHLRLAGDWAVQFRVVFDYELADVLAGLVSAETVLATCSPNSSVEELSVGWRPSDSHFPVGPRDERRQIEMIDGLIAEAVAAGAQIVVLPELAVTEQMAFSLEDWVRRPGGPRVLVAGTYHHQDNHPTEGDSPRRRNTAVTWVCGHEAPLLHDKHSPGDRPIMEDIQPDGWPELRVYVTRDGWHIVIAICRDLLNPAAVHALCEAGANLILVPAMSETLLTFGGPTAQLVGANQALVAIANNPARWPGGAQSDRALFGHPGIGRQTKAVTSQDTNPGVALMPVRSAAVTWRTTRRRRSQRRKGRPPSLPRWVDLVAAGLRAPVSTPHADGVRITLKRAAVLVLLSEGAQGPTVLVSERAAELSTYAGQWVFPGGSVDAHDPDVVATALREAREEVGLDPTSVEVLGLLAPHVLLETGFLVTPVLAWSAEPVFDLAPNRGEVAAVRWLALHRTDQTALSGIALGLGAMTRSVLLQLACQLPNATIDAQHEIIRTHGV